MENRFKKFFFIYFRIRVEVLEKLKINEIHPQSQVDDLVLLFINTNRKPA